MTKTIDTPIVFFDGICGLCNTAVDVLLRVDKKERLRFAPLQGETAQRYLPHMEGDPDSWSLIYLDENGLRDQSDAALAICHQLGGVWYLAEVFYLIPRSLRNILYRGVARNRYRIFGKRDACRIPTEAERARFLP